MIMYRQKSLDGASPSKFPFQTQAFCSCDWESRWSAMADFIEVECEDHLHEVWLLSQGEPA